MFSNATNIDLVNRGASENYYSAMVRGQIRVINRVLAAAVHYGASATAGDRHFPLCIHNTQCSAFHSGYISGQNERRGKGKRDAQETTPPCRFDCHCKTGSNMGIKYQAYTALMLFTTALQAAEAGSLASRRIHNSHDICIRFCRQHM